MKLGLSSYTLTWAVGVPGYEKPQAPIRAVDLLRIAHQNGLALVQICDNIPLHLLSEEELDELNSLAKELGIELEIGTRGTSPEHLLMYLAIARRLQASLFRTLITEPDIHIAEQQLRAVLPDFESAGIKIAIENHGLHTTSQLINLFRSLDSKWLGCCLDTVNSFGALEGPEEVIRELLPYTINLHLKDFDIVRVDHQMGFTILGKPAGYGKLNIEKLLKAAIPYNHANAILELWTPYSATVEDTIRLERDWMDSSIHYLKKQLQII
ncbi:sugar phosphate isomerase/epimerase family protein [Paenibacillus glycanilyticus]|uniref:sugar phosphate isomerase/epimerase family protein n=1 Tax=Paenibacillus glycanilyticus TaxID=126569 RepID=UPI003EBD0D6A